MYFVQCICTPSGQCTPVSLRNISRTCLHFPNSLWTRTSNLHKCVFFNVFAHPLGSAFPSLSPTFHRTCLHFPNSSMHSFLSPQHFTELVCIFPLACGQEHQIYINVFFQCICTPSGQCIPFSLPNISQNLFAFSN